MSLCWAASLRWFALSRSSEPLTFSGSKRERKAEFPRNGAGTIFPSGPRLSTPPGEYRRLAPRLAPEPRRAAKIPRAAFQQAGALRSLP